MPSDEQPGPDLPDPRNVRAALEARPRGYRCYRASAPIEVGGRGHESAWAHAPWTEEFVDIEGDARPAPALRTRVKMLHDDAHLYILAEMIEPHVRATITQRNAVIFHDNDFEVFIDPDGDTHDYYELEINALGTVWELSLPQPYRTGASPRDPHPMPGLRTAVRIDGAINDPTATDRGWWAEIALPFAGLARHAGKVACPPHDGDRWRINFSRVQWPLHIEAGSYVKLDGDREDNWVWSPQGVVDMHRPASWGIVEFSEMVAAAALPASKGPIFPGPDEHPRRVLTAVWECQRVRTHPASDARALALPSDAGPVTITVKGDGRWHAAACIDEGAWMNVDETGRLWASRTPGP